MATRGTAILITNNNLLVSTEFNGDMYPHGYGDEFFQGLSMVKNNLDFQEFLDEFNQENFGYSEDMVYEYPHDTLYSSKGKCCEHINLIEKYTVFYSDWLFFKNLTNETITIEVLKNGIPKTIEMYPDETVRFRFNCLPDDGIQYKLI